MIEVKKMSAINGNRSCSLFGFFGCETRSVEKTANSSEKTPIKDNNPKIHQTMPESKRKNPPKPHSTTPTRSELYVVLAQLSHKIGNFQVFCNNSIFTHLHYQTLKIV